METNSLVLTYLVIAFIGSCFYSYSNVQKEKLIEEQKATISKLESFIDKKIKNV